MTLHYINHCPFHIPFLFCTITIDHQLYHHHHHHHGHPHPHPDHHDGHDRDVNNAINQGGQLELGIGQMEKAKEEKSDRGELWKSHMEISWKSYGYFMENHKIS